MRVIARELLWLLVSLVFGIVSGVIFISFLELEPEFESLSTFEKVFEMEVYLIGVILGIIGTYLMRIVAWALKKNVIKDSYDS